MRGNARMGHHEAGCGLARYSMAWLGEARLGEMKHGEAREQGLCVVTLAWAIARLDVVGQGKIRRSLAWQGGVWFGVVGQGKGTRPMRGNARMGLYKAGCGGVGQGGVE